MKLNFKNAMRDVFLSTCHSKLHLYGLCLYYLLKYLFFSLGYTITYTSFTSHQPAYP